MVELAPLETIDRHAIEQLLDRTFGADRHQRTAYRLRAGTGPIAGPSLAAIEGGTLVGSIQFWPVLFTGDDERQVPLTMVGPVAVDPARQRGGLGRLMMQAAIAEASDMPLMLIGDPEYYARFFGFSADRTSGWRLPGPVDRHRLLARGKDVPDGAGTIGPRVQVAA